jgi:starch synthase
MRIMHVAAELAPIAKVGGLGDVTYGLAMAQKELGHHVSVILPRYDVLQSAYISEISIVSKHLIWNYYHVDHHHNVWSGKIDDLDVLLVDTLNPSDFFDRGRIYGCADDIIRFLYFSRTVVEFLKTLKEMPDVLHVHDWQSAAVVPLVKQMNLSCKVVFTVHNMEYQGRCSPKEAESIGLQNIEKYRDNVYPEAINVLKSALLEADQVSTVSPSYAQETFKSSQGMGMESTLNEIKGKYRGILNGIDSTYWNPSHDDFLPRHFSEKSLFRGKQMAKDLLRKRLKLALNNKPLIVNIGRLVPQKGVELIRHALHYTIENGGQFILQGTSPIDQIKRDFLNLKESLADHPDVHMELHLEEELTHMIYAAADFFLVPSKFEPCGLTQLIALKYGAIPIVRKTGGLQDTVQDIDTHPKGNGIVFEEESTQSLEAALKRAFTLWNEEKDRFQKLQLQGARSNFGWEKPAKEYLKLYSNKK